MKTNLRISCRSPFPFAACVGASGSSVPPWPQFPKALLDPYNSSCHAVFWVPRQRKRSSDPGSPFPCRGDIGVLLQAVCVCHQSSPFTCSPSRFFFLSFIFIFFFFVISHSWFPSFWSAWFLSFGCL